MLTEGHNDETGLDRNFVDSFADEGSDKKHLERNLEVATGQTSQVEQRIGNLK
jgi:hypothetical protein